MSLTIEQQAQDYAPVFNPLYYVMSSDEVANYDFFFYWVQILDAGANIIWQDRFIPRYDNELLLYDASRALEAYVSFDISGISGGTSGVRKASNIYKEYSVRFIEEYGAVASGLVSGDTTTISSKYAFNGVFLPEDAKYYDEDNYVVDDSFPNGVFLTDMTGANIRVKQGDAFELGWMTVAGATEPSKNVVIKTYNSSGSLIGTYKIANSFSAGTTTDAKFLSINVGTAELNASTLSSGSQPIITSGVATYEVYIENNSATQVSAAVTFEIDRTCYRTTGLRLFWVNSLGRIDAFNFNFAYERSKDVEQSRFRRLRGSFTGSTFSTSDTETGSTNFYTKSERRLKVRTDYINNMEAKWLENLIDSPAIWALIDGKILPMVMDTKTYRRQTIELNKLFSVEFDLMYSVSSYRQRL